MSPHPLTTSRSPCQCRSTESFWDLNPDMVRSKRSGQSFAWTEKACRKSAGVILLFATLSCVAVSATEGTSSAKNLATPTDPETSDEDRNSTPTDSGFQLPEAIALSPIHPDSDLEANAEPANVATLADESLLSESLFVDNSTRSISSDLETAPPTAELFGAEATPMDERFLDILDPWHQSKPKKWSASFKTGYSWIDKPRISNTRKNDGGDSILTAGASLDYLLPGSNEERKFNFAAAYNYDFYSKHTDLNGDNANVALGGKFTHGLTSLNFSAAWQRTNGSNAIVADEVSSDTVSALLGLSREITSKTSLNIGARYSLNLYESFLSSSSLGWFAGASYNFSPKTQLGMRYIAGVTEQKNSENRTYQGADLTFHFQPGPRTTLNGSIGFQENSSDSPEFEGSGPGLVFSLGSAWKVTEKTSLTLSGSRGSSGSPLQQNQDVTTTHGLLSLNWRLSKQFSCSSGIAFSMDEFSDDQNSEHKTGANRNNNYWSLRESLSYQISPHWSADLYYEYSNNASDNAESAYESNKLGANLRLVF